MFDFCKRKNNCYIIFLAWMTQRRKIQQCTKHVCRSHLKYFHLFRVVLPCVLYCWNTCKYSSKVCIGLLIFLHSIPCFLCKRLCLLNRNLISQLFCSVSHLHVKLVILCPNIKKHLRYRYKSYTNKCVYIYIYVNKNSYSNGNFL